MRENSGKTSPYLRPNQEILMSDSKCSNLEITIIIINKRQILKQKLKILSLEVIGSGSSVVYIFVMCFRECFANVS